MAKMKRRVLTVHLTNSVTASYFITHRSAEGRYNVAGSNLPLMNSRFEQIQHGYCLYVLFWILTMRVKTNHTKVKLRVETANEDVTKDPQRTGRWRNVQADEPTQADSGSHLFNLKQDSL